MNAQKVVIKVEPDLRDVMLALHVLRGLCGDISAAADKAIKLLAAPTPAPGVSETHTDPKEEQQ